MASSYAAWMSSRRAQRGGPSTDTAVPAGVHLALLAVQLFFSGMHVISKEVLTVLHPLSLAVFRVVFATPILLALAWHHDRVLPARRELPRLALLGLLGVFINQVLFIVGLSYTTATNAAILMPSIPVFAVAVGALLGIERIGPRRLACIGLTVAGCLVLLDPRRLELSAGSSVGNLLILMNCLSYAAFLVLQRPILQRLPWRTVIAWSFLFGSLGVLAAGWRPTAALEAASVPAPIWWGVAFIVVFPTAIGYALNTWAVRRSTPSLVAAYTTLQPLATALLAVIFLGETLGWREAAGFVLISAGLWGASRLIAPAGRRPTED